ncbi:MAG: hypothetical protein ABI885_16430 [Gammaproteobacteria bacterium]
MNNAIRLRQLILGAVEHVPFYRQHWREAGVDLTRVGSAVHLEFLPVVRRADLPADAPIDPQALKRRRWRFVRALMDVGYIPGERMMLITNSPHPRAASLIRWTYVDPQGGDSEVLATYARTRPQVLYGPLSSLMALARRVLVSPEVKCRPKLVITTAGELNDANRGLLESAFGAGVADFYATSELGLVAYSIPGRRGYQLQSREFHVELLPVGDGSGLERLVVTDLADESMPLIRFDTGDRVRRDRSRPGAPVVEIHGRAEEPRPTLLRPQPETVAQSPRPALFPRENTPEPHPLFAIRTG